MGVKQKRMIKIKTTWTDSHPSEALLWIACRWSVLRILKHCISDLSIFKIFIHVIVLFFRILIDFLYICTLVIPSLLHCLYLLLLRILYSSIEFFCLNFFISNSSLLISYCCLSFSLIIVCKKVKKKEKALYQLIYQGK